MWTAMKNNLLGKKFLSFSFYLYRFRKYVSYSFPRINFCNPRVHYETPCTYIVCVHAREIYCIFTTCCIISILFSKRCCVFHNFIFNCSNNNLPVSVSFLVWSFLPNQWRCTGLLLHPITLKDTHQTFRRTSLHEGSAHSRENNTCFINHALKFKYQPGCFKVKAN